MRLTTIKSETAVTTLADRLYTNLTPASRKAVEAALIRANPQLADPHGFKTGIVVHVPDVPDVSHQPGTTTQDPLAAATAGLKDALEVYGGELAGNLKQATADIEEQAVLLKQREVAAAIKSDKDAAELAKSMTASLRERAKQLADEGKQLDGLLKQIVSDLGSFGGG